MKLEEGYEVIGSKFNHEDYSIFFTIKNHNNNETFIRVIQDGKHICDSNQIHTLRDAYDLVSETIYGFEIIPSKFYSNRNIQSMLRMQEIMIKKHNYVGNKEVAKYLANLTTKRIYENNFKITNKNDDEPFAIFVKSEKYMHSFNKLETFRDVYDFINVTFFGFEIIPSNFYSTKNIQSMIKLQEIMLKKHGYEGDDVIIKYLANLTAKALYKNNLEITIKK